MPRAKTTKTRLRKASKAHTIYKTSDGTRVPGVTTIVGLLAKPQLLPWANKLGLDGIEYKTYMQQTADAGTCGHAMVEAFLMDEEPVLDDFTGNQIRAGEFALNHFKRWMDEHNVEIVASEMDMVSDTHRYGGKCDMIAVVDGVLELVDLKTGSGIYDEMFIQVAGYAILAEEHDFQIQRCRVLNIPREENQAFQEAHAPALEYQKKLFLALLGVYKARAELKKVNR